MIRQSWLVQARPLICKFVPAAAAICFLAWCLVALKSDFSWDDAEPEILNQAWRLARGENIYHGIDSPPFTFSVYPPVYLGLVAFLMKFSGLSYLPAKLISLIAGLSIGGALLYLARRWNKSGGLWAACFLFLIPAFLYNLIRSHVQMLAVAFSIWSLVFFIRNRKFETLVISPIFAILAFYTKQTQVALPLAMAIYLAVRNRRWLFPYLSVLAIGTLIPFVALQKITNSNFWLDTVLLARLRYDVRIIPLVLLHHAGPILLFISIACMTLCRRLKNLTIDPMDCYFGCTLLVTLVSVGRIGAHGQYVLELLAVTLIYLLLTTDLPSLRGKEVLVTIQILILFLYTPLSIFFEEGSWDRAANKACKEIYASITKAPPGPVLSQQGSFALFGRGEIYIQLFHFSELARTGIWDQSHIVGAIERRTFPYVITEFAIDRPEEAESDRERFSPEMIGALRKHYRLEKSVYPYFLYAPVK